MNYTIKKGDSKGCRVQVLPSKEESAHSPHEWRLEEEETVHISASVDESSIFPFLAVTVSQSAVTVLRQALVSKEYWILLMIHQTFLANSRL